MNPANKCSQYFVSLGSFYLLLCLFSFYACKTFPWLVCPKRRRKCILAKPTLSKTVQLYQEYDYHFIWEWWKAYWNAHGADFRKISEVRITQDGYESATAHFLCSIKGVLDIKIPITVIPGQIYGSHWPLMLLSYTLGARITLHFPQPHVRNRAIPSSSHSSHLMLSCFSLTLHTWSVNYLCGSTWTARSRTR